MAGLLWLVLGTIVSIFTKAEECSMFSWHILLGSWSIYLRKNITVLETRLKLTAVTVFGLSVVEHKERYVCHALPLFNNMYCLSHGTISLQFLPASVQKMELSALFGSQEGASAFIP